MSVRRALPLLRPLLPLAVVAQRWWRRMVRPDLRGVRVAAFNPTGHVLLIRHAYGDTARWRLPGGGIKRDESPAVAAARELREETGLEATELRGFDQYHAILDGASDLVTLFTARVEGEPRGDGFEIAEARFWPADRLPPLTPATARRLEEIGGGRVATGRW